MGVALTGRAETLQQAAAEFAQREGCSLDVVHTYTAHDGTPLHWKLRGRRADGSKWIKPLKQEGDTFVLGEPEYSDGKPLYRLHELTACPGATVIVTEGESCADVLAALGLLATTSGSATSAGAANWSPLASREVRIWPDYDEAGIRYRDAVASAVTRVGSRVCAIDAAQLNLPPKGDAVDWVKKHPGATVDQVMRLPVADVPSLSDVGEIQEFAYSGGRFEYSTNGVVFVRSSETSEPERQWLCSPIRVCAKTRDSKNGGWGRLLEWLDDDGVPHRWPMPMELLQGDGADVFRELARQGLSIAPGRRTRDLLAAYIQMHPGEVRARSVDRVGWQGDVFVVGGEVIGNSREVLVYQDGHAVEPAYSSAGTLAEWQDTIARPAAGNSRLVFAICAAFAPALVDIIGEDSGGFHFRGPSSHGKSTALRVAASVLGRPSEYVRTWRSTTNGLEGLAAVHNDSLLVLDELNQLDPREAGEAAYLLANGQGKARASRVGTARPAQRWRVLFLSAGEQSMSTLAEKAGRKLTAGQEIRMADIEADAQAGQGIFEELSGFASPAAFADALKAAADRTYGTVGREWLQLVVRERSALASTIPDLVQRFCRDVVMRDASGQVARVAKRFGLVAAAGEIATAARLTGWDHGEAEMAVKRCYRAWLDGFGSESDREERTLREQVKAFFGAHGASRFEEADAPERPIFNRAGIVRTVDGGSREYLVYPDTFKREVCEGVDPRWAAGRLVAWGWLRPGDDGRMTRKDRISVRRGSPRLYVFTSRMWDDD